MELHTSLTFKNCGVRRLKWSLAYRFWSYKQSTRGARQARVVSAATDDYDDDDDDDKKRNVLRLGDKVRPWIMDRTHVQ